MDLDHLASVACQLVARVREDDPQSNQRWLYNTTSAWEREALLYVLAAAVPDSVSWLTLTNWTTLRERRLRPHGTPAAVRRHNYHKERLCELCAAYERERKQNYRARQAAA